tara:strand:+ start:590 stop:931 length:342 start_codon:yes stop_codon:yes gene_type:complete
MNAEELIEKVSSLAPSIQGLHYTLIDEILADERRGQDVEKLMEINNDQPLTRTEATFLREAQKIRTDVANLLKGMTNKKAFDFASGEFRQGLTEALIFDLRDPLEDFIKRHNL